MVPGDSATHRRTGLAVTVVGLGLLLAFLLGWTGVEDTLLSWAVFLAGILLTAGGTTLIRLSEAGESG